MRKMIYKALVSFAIMGFSYQATFAQAIPFDDLPPQPTEYGKCYAKCKIPDQYESVDLQVLTKEASTKTVTKPAVYETVTEQVLVKEASRKLIPVPAEYETITEQVLIKEGATKVTQTPPKYKTVTEKVLVTAAYGKWVRKLKYPTCVGNDCYVLCWEEQPAKYKSVSKRILVSGGDSRTTEIPAQYKTVTKRVLRTPATVREVEVPAQYKTITKKVVSVPASSEEVVIPAEYRTVTEKKLMRQGGYTRWTEVLCDKDINGGVIRSVQRALKNKGYNPGPIDGVYGSQTKSALQKYQSDNGLPLGNLNKETLASLGLNY